MDIPSPVIVPVVGDGTSGVSQSIRAHFRPFLQRVIEIELNAVDARNHRRNASIYLSRLEAQTFAAALAMLVHEAWPVDCLEK